EGGAFAESILADDQEVGAAFNHSQSHKVVSGTRTDPANTGGTTSHGAYRALVTADGVTAVGDHGNIVFAIREDHVGERVALLDPDCDGAVLPVIAEVGELRLLDLARPGREEDKLVFDKGDVLVLIAVGLDAQDRGDFFLGSQIEQVLD